MTVQNSTRYYNLIWDVIQINEEGILGSTQASAADMIMRISWEIYHNGMTDAQAIYDKVTA